MFSVARIVLLLISGVCCSHASAQGGLRLILWDYEMPTEGRGASQYMGFGYDHDLNERSSLGLDVRLSLGEPGWGVQYRSAFHVADNDASSFYLGPTIGIRSVGEDPIIMVPLGARMGVRGGLENFYADLFLGFITNLGAPDTRPSDYSSAPKLSGLNLLIGLNLGFGWERRTAP